MLDHVVSTTIDPRAYVVPKLLDQPHHETVHLGLASGGWGLCLGSSYAQEQQRRHRETHHCALPDPHLHHHDTSMAKQSAPETLHTQSPAWRGLLCLSHALGE